MIEWGLAGTLGFLTAMLSALTGLAGGVVLLTGLSFFLPMAAVVPIHAATQGIAGASRLSVFWREIDWPIAARLLPASLLGVAIAVPIVPHMRPEIFTFLVAAVLLFSGLVERPKLPGLANNTGLVAWGVGSGSLGLLAGSNGPLISALLLGRGKVGAPHVATKAAVQSLTNAGKLLSLWFITRQAWLDSFDLVLPLALGTILGTWAAKRLSRRISESTLRPATRGLLVATAVLLVVQTLL